MTFSDISLASFQGGLILAMAYGYEAQGRNDRRVELARQFSDIGSQSVLPGALLVNDLPFCMCYTIFHISLMAMITIVRHIPEWLPWLSYKPFAHLGYNLAQEAKHGPIRFVKESMVFDCFVSAHVRRTHCVSMTFIAQWDSAAFTCSSESTGCRKA
jgi:hypothetical protein